LHAGQFEKQVLSFPFTRGLAAQFAPTFLQISGIQKISAGVTLVSPGITGTTSGACALNIPIWKEFLTVITPGLLLGAGIKPSLIVQVLNYVLNLLLMLWVHGCSVPVITKAKFREVVQKLLMILAGDISG